jgi:hypothetical protein
MLQSPADMRAPNASPRAIASLALLLASLAPSAARAQTCTMLPPGRPSDGPAPNAAVQRSAMEAVTRSLIDGGHTVIATEDAQRRMIGEPFQECNALECGASVVQSLGVDFAVLVTIWAPRGTPTSVVVALIGATDSAAGDAPVESGDAVAAALRALQTALQRWQAAHMGFLEVRSMPPGATVEVDGRVIGTTPVRHLVHAGQRSVRVYLDGYDDIEQSMRIEPTREHPLELALVAADESSAPIETHTEPHFANFLIGGALIAGGIGALVSPILTLATEGECRDEPGAVPTGFCATETRLGATSAILLGVGAAAIIGGLVFMIAQPIVVTVAASPESAMLVVGGAF